EPAIAAKTISLLVNEKDAMRVTLAAEIGKIRLIMRSARPDAPDDDETAQAQVNVQDILGGDSSSGSSDYKGSSSSGLSLGGSPSLTPLPPVGPSLGDAVEKGANGLADILKVLKDTHDNGITQEKKTWKITL